MNKKYIVALRDKETDERQLFEFPTKKKRDWFLGEINLRFFDYLVTEI
jgi:hypothetical protein